MPRSSATSEGKNLSPSDPVPSLLTTREVCNLLRVTKPTVYEMVEAGTLRIFKMKKNIRIRREDVEEARGFPITEAEYLAAK